MTGITSCTYRTCCAGFGNCTVSATVPAGAFASARPKQDKQEAKPTTSNNDRFIRSPVVNYTVGHDGNMQATSPRTDAGFVGRVGQIGTVVECHAVNATSIVWLPAIKAVRKIVVSNEPHGYQKLSVPVTTTMRPKLVDPNEP